MNEAQGEALADACSFFALSDSSKSDLSESDLIRLHSALAEIDEQWLPLTGYILNLGFTRGISSGGSVEGYIKLLQYAPSYLSSASFVETLHDPDKVKPFIESARERQKRDRIRSLKSARERQKRDRIRSLSEALGGFNGLSSREKILLGGAARFREELEYVEGDYVGSSVEDMVEGFHRELKEFEPSWISDRLSEAGRPRRLRKHDRALELNPAKVEFLREYDPFEGDKPGVFIYGPTGAGKTRAVLQMAESYLARYLARKWYGCLPPLDENPVFMTTGEDLSKFVSGSESIPDAAKFVIFDDLQNYKPRPSELARFQPFIKRLFDDRPVDRFYLFTSQVSPRRLCKGGDKRIGWNNKGALEEEAKAIHRRLRQLELAKMDVSPLPP